MLWFLIEDLQFAGSMIKAPFQFKNKCLSVKVERMEWKVFRIRDQNYHVSKVYKFKFCIQWNKLKYALYKNISIKSLLYLNESSSSFAIVKFYNFKYVSLQGQVLIIQPLYIYSFLLLRNIFSRFWTAFRFFDSPFYMKFNVLRCSW